MRLPCEVIEDLLALYHDDVCSELTKEIVEEHLAQCASCKAKLDLIEEEIHLPQQDYEAVDTLKKIKKKVKIKQKKQLQRIQLLKQKKKQRNMLMLKKQI